MEPVHVELSDKGRNIGMLKVLSTKLHISQGWPVELGRGYTYASTFENSLLGAITKLSSV